MSIDKKKPSPIFWVRSWRLAQMVLAKCFGSNDNKKLALMVAQFSLSVWKTSKLSHQPNAIKDFFPVNAGVFLYLQEKNTDCNAINTFYLYLQEEFTDQIYRRISPVITGVFL
jgi:hypothetical protein